MQAKQKKQSRFNSHLLLILISFLMVGYVLLKIYKYVAFTSLIVVGIFILVILLIIISIMQLASEKSQSKTFKKVANIINIIFLICLLAGAYVITSVDNSFSNIFINDNQETTLTGVLITYDNDEITSVEQVASKTVGILEGDQIPQANSGIKAELASLDIEVQYEEYATYPELLKALFDKKIDVAAATLGYSSIFSTEDNYDDELAKVKIIYTYTTSSQTKTDTETDVDVENRGFTFLLVGTDGYSFGNADTIMLGSFNPDTFKVTLTSIPRDSYVDIGCLGYSFKINAARVTQQCLIDTVEDVMQTEINFYVETNFDGVVDVVDALGGITINSPIAFDGQAVDSMDANGNYYREDDAIHIPAGEYLANGREALSYARERHAFAAGDFARIEHQQEIISAIINKTLELNNVNKMLAVLNAAGNNIKTNISMNQLADLASLALNKYKETGSTDFIQIESSQVEGYGGSKYFSSMDLNLYIYNLDDDSIAENRELIIENLK